jgi:hypothetical protein
LFVCLKTIDQSRLNYEIQNQYKIQIEFSNQSNSFQQIFSIDLENINESPSHFHCSTITGFCTVIEEDFNQTLTFQLKLTKEFQYEIICTDNGQPPLSVNECFSYSKLSFFFLRK